MMRINEAAKDYKYDRYGNQHTYTDYSSWDDGERWELIDGIAYMMSAPSVAHQSISGEIFRQLANFLHGKQCKVFAAPFDVCLFAKGDGDDTVVQPDLLVVCDQSKLDEKRCNGAPDMIIEILSPSTSSHDRIRKLNKYMQAGVQEFWIVDPEHKDVTAYFLIDGVYVVAGAYESGETISVKVLEGCTISLQEVFAT